MATGGKIASGPNEFINSKDNILKRQKRCLATCGPVIFAVAGRHACIALLQTAAAAFRATWVRHCSSCTFHRVLSFPFIHQSRSILSECSAAICVDSGCVYNCLLLSVCRLLPLILCSSPDQTSSSMYGMSGSENRLWAFATSVFWCWRWGEGVTVEMEEEEEAAEGGQEEKCNNKLESELSR